MEPKITNCKDKITIQTFIWQLIYSDTRKKYLIKLFLVSIVFYLLFLHLEITLPFAQLCYAFVEKTIFLQP